MSLSISCIDTLNYDQSIYAIKRTINTLKQRTSVDHVYWYSDVQLPSTIEGVNVTNVIIDKLTGQTSYSKVTMKMCPTICQQDFDLIVQWDGYAVNSDAWTDDFFKYDYIGATWDDGVIGNGGFSLRSRKLYNAMNQLDVGYQICHFDPSIITPYIQSYPDWDGNKFVPEDVLICRVYKNQLENLGIQFAPHAVADRFSIENHSFIAPWTGVINQWVGKSLGFHGKYGIRQLYN